MKPSVQAIRATARRPPAHPMQLKASGSARMPAPMDELTSVRTEERAEAAGASSNTTVAMVGPGGRAVRRRERRVWRLKLGRKAVHALAAEVLPHSQASAPRAPKGPSGKGPQRLRRGPQRNAAHLQAATAKLRSRDKAAPTPLGDPASG